MNISIQFNFDELPGEGICTHCKEIIDGSMFIPFVQCGDAKSSQYLEIKYCEECYIEIFGEAE